MRISTSIYRILLAVLLLSGFLASAGGAALAPQARYAATQWQYGRADKDTVIVEGRDAHDAALHAQRQWPAGHSAGSGTYPAGDRCCFSLPASMPLAAGCSKSGLKRHLSMLLDRYEYPQRLSLYPKHGFW